MMQYILSEKEYNELIVARNKIEQLETGKLQKLCTKIANEMPVAWGWGGPDPKPWGCILTDPGEWYCDKCPVQEICPHEEKEWSK